MICRLCNHPTRAIVDLGISPPANKFKEDYKNSSEIAAFPLQVDFCDNCKNLQLRDCLSAEVLYSDYNYITPEIRSLSTHYQNIIKYLSQKLRNFSNANVLEIGSNSGELLGVIQNHVKSVLGVDPAKNICKLANKRGIPTINKFFNLQSPKAILKKHGKQNIIIARHMFAHNQYPQLILDGIKTLLSDDGILLIENAYAIDTLKNSEFDQIYHEHMYFYSATSIKNFLQGYKIYLKDIFFADVHGGSAVFIASTNQAKVSKKLKETLELEQNYFNDNLIFKSFTRELRSLKKTINQIIDKHLELGYKVVAYGAPAKAFTMFAYFGLDHSRVDCCIDTTPTKIGKTFPFFDIPIFAEDHLDSINKKLILVNAWNYKKDIISKSKKIFKKGDILLFPLPTIEKIEI